MRDLPQLVEPGRRLALGQDDRARVAPVAGGARGEVGHDRVAGLQHAVVRPALAGGRPLDPRDQVAGDRHASAVGVLHGAADVGEDLELGAPDAHRVERGPLPDHHQVGAVAQRGQLLGGLGGPLPGERALEIDEPAEAVVQRVAQVGREAGRLDRQDPAGPGPLDQPQHGARVVGPQVDHPGGAEPLVGDDLVGVALAGAGLLDVDHHQPGAAVGGHQRGRRAALERHRPGLDRHLEARRVADGVVPGQEGEVGADLARGGGDAQAALVGHVGVSMRRGLSTRSARSSASPSP